MTLNIFAPGVNRSFSSELNSNFTKTQIRKFTSSIDTTEYSKAISNGIGTIGYDLFTYSKTFTPTEDCLILAVTLNADIKTSADTANYRLKITNSDTATSFRILSKGNTSIPYGYMASTASSTYVPISEQGVPMSTTTNTLPFPMPIMAQAGSGYTFEVEVGLTNNTSATAYLDNTQVIIYWSPVSADSVSTFS